jgi:hypothetical protein
MSAHLPPAYARVNGSARRESVREPLGVHFVKNWRAFCDLRDRIQRNWPRLCRDCGNEFRDYGRTLVRCAACRSRHRQLVP